MLASSLSRSSRGQSSGFAGRLLALAVCLLAAGCAGNWKTDYEKVEATAVQNWRISAVSVAVPESLSVSNANVLAPNADIVWHGDPPGDRKAQVKAIMTNAALQATASLSGRQNAQLNIVLQEFHGVTPAAIARAPGAVHNIRFTAQVVERGSNRPLTAPMLIRADLAALVGSAAYYNSAALTGEDQKTRVTRHLTQTLRGWLGVGPDNRGSFSSPGR